ncbi:MAG: hypothetical protein K0S38_1042 [Candidatus Paceibacter sp.]|jgi:hypothetical protein|nr:hypothetical protein [Candidatus Paceibacter sp.]
MSKQKWEELTGFVRIPVPFSSLGDAAFRDFIRHGIYTKLVIELKTKQIRAMAVELCQELGKLLAEFNIRKLDPIIVCIGDIPEVHRSELQTYFGNRGIEATPLIFKEYVLSESTAETR